MAMSWCPGAGMQSPYGLWPNYSRMSRWALVNCCVQSDGKTHTKILFLFFFKSKIHNCKHDYVNGHQKNEEAHFLQTDYQRFNKVSEILEYPKTINSFGSYKEYHNAIKNTVCLGFTIIFIWFPFTLILSSWCLDEDQDISEENHILWVILSKSFWIHILKY